MGTSPSEVRKMSGDSYSESLSGVLKQARDAPTPERATPVENDRRPLLRAAALVAVLSMIQTVDDQSRIARELGDAWTEDHRRTRMGKSNLMALRSQRATWR
jgi:hypothetical protein